MSSSYVCDAHTIIWYIGKNQLLGANAQAALADSTSCLYLPVIALAEACHIVARGRTVIPSVGE
jgi:PIN domain nuclease of toxin-antitoxin system